MFGKRKLPWCISAVLLLSTVGIGVARAQSAGEEHPVRLANPFFALVNCVRCERFDTAEKQVRVLAELGYDGIAPSGTEGVAEMLSALDRHHLKLFALYVGLELDPDRPSHDPALPEVIGRLRGRETCIWLYVRSKRFKPKSPEGDARAAKLIGQVADMAKQAGLRVALYPHTWFYVESVEDALRLVEKVGRPNVGVTFNLCHWLKVHGPGNPEPLLRRAMPHLMLVTINGADEHGRNWDRLIQPLDCGTFDTTGLVATLHRLGYTGPIGLQCYGVPGEKYENLRRSIAAWRRISATVAAGQESQSPSQ